MASDIQDKIAKLIAQAEGTNHPAEAEAFMAQAEKLMLKYGIEQAELDARRPGQVKADIVTRRVVIPNGHGYAMAMIEIAHYLATPFSLQTLQSSLPDGGRVAWLIGHRADVEQAETLLNTLLVQSKAQAIHWWKTDGRHNTIWYTDNDAYLARREFIFAFARGAWSRLREIRNTVVAEAGSGAELVLVDRKAQVDRWVADNVKVGKARATNRRTGGDAARTAGFQSGRESVSPRAVGK